MNKNTINKQIVTILRQSHKPLQVTFLSHYTEDENNTVLIAIGKRYIHVSRKFAHAIKQKIKYRYPYQTIVDWSIVSNACRINDQT